MNGLVVMVLAAGCGRVGFDDRATADGARAEAGTDAAAGAWHTVMSVGDTLYTGDPHPVQIAVATGDLVMVACDTESGAVPAITMDTAPAGIVALPPATTAHDAISGYTTILAWAVATGTATVTITMDGFAAFPYSDCAATTFHGGIGAPQLVDRQTSLVAAGALTTCPAVATARDGLAFYMAPRTYCAGAPASGPYVGLGTTYGNPWGAWAPTDGTAQAAALGDCDPTGSGGTGMCTTVSLSP